MTAEERAPALPPDALLAARLCAVDPRGLGGLLLRGGDHEAREEVVAALAAGLPAGAAVRRIAGGIEAGQLAGGIDLAAALAGHGAVTRPGVLAEADGGLLVVNAGERLAPAAAALLGAALDDGEVARRDGPAASARIALAAIEGGEGVAASLGERLAFHVRLGGEEAALASPPVMPASTGMTINRGRATIALADDDVFRALAATAAAFGIGSMRAPLFALRAARAAAALDGRTALAEADLDLAARLVLGPRATRLPEAAEEATDEARGEESPPPAEGEPSSEGARLEDRVIAATRAALPADLLESLATGQVRRGPSARAKGASERRRSLRRGRPAGVRAGDPRGGARLALIDTLRAAAPWQRVRGRTGRVLVRRADLRIRRFEARAGLVTIFAVDASGSAAAARLAEAKGAVELLLARAYIQRAEVALVAFRGRQAELLLPPTRSLARARRALAELPGGGGTPLAAGLAAARGVALAVRARGRTPFVVLLSDGRANVAADGQGGRSEAARDADVAARALAADGIAAVFVDTAARPRAEAARLAVAMRARYLALPYAGAAAVDAAVRAAAPA